MFSKGLEPYILQKYGPQSVINTIQLHPHILLENVILICCAWTSIIWKV